MTLQITALDTATNTEVTLTSEDLLDFDTFDIDYLDTVFDYDDFNPANVQLTKKDGVPSYVADTNEDIAACIDAYVKIGEDAWEKSTLVATTTEDLATIGEAAVDLDDADMLDTYLVYADHMNYVPDVSHFRDAYQGDFTSRENFAYSLIDGGVVSADSIIQEHGTIASWAEGDLRFDFEFVDYDGGVRVFRVM